MLVELNLDGTVGGSYFSLFYLVAGFDKTQFKPIVVFATPNSLIPRFRAADIVTLTMTPRYPASTHIRLLRPFVRAFNCVAGRLHTLKRFLRCIQLLRQEQISLLHLNNSLDHGHEWMIAARILRIPCITHERGLGTDYTPAAYRLAPTLAAVLCISKAVQQNLITKGFGSLALSVVHNGLDPNAMKTTTSPETIRAEFGLPATCRLIGMVGNIQRWKGQDVLLEAMVQLQGEFPNIVCIMIGDVSPHDPSDIAFHKHLHHLIRQYRLGDRVILTGFRQDVANYINAVEILVHASVTPEPFGRVLLEGMALRKPVVASRGGAVDEVVCDGETGLLYTPGDSADLAACLRRLLNNPEEQRAMGHAGYRRLVAHFGIDKNVKTTERIYSSILALRPAPGTRSFRS